MAAAIIPAMCDPWPLSSAYNTPSERVVSTDNPRTQLGMAQIDSGIQDDHHHPCSP